MSYNSSNHHWWPITLQKFWEDSDGYVSRIDPTGNVDKKKPKNRKLGLRIRGHSLFGNNKGPDNFEKIFDQVDNFAYELIEGLLELETIRSLDGEAADFSIGNPLLHDRFKVLEETKHRRLLEVIFSLIIRSPAWRNKYERVPTAFGQPQNENVGKGNMRYSFEIAQKLCRASPLILHKFILLRSTNNGFILGDGYLDWLSDEIFSLRIRGKALLPLTPNLCIYFSTYRSTRSSRNIVALEVTDSEQEIINYFSQVHAKQHLFFKGCEPKLEPCFTHQEFNEISPRELELFNFFDSLWAH